MFSFGKIQFVQINFNKIMWSLKKYCSLHCLLFAHSNCLWRGPQSWFHFMDKHFMDKLKFSKSLFFCLLCLFLRLPRIIFINIGGISNKIYNFFLFFPVFWKKNQFWRKNLNFLRKFEFWRLALKYEPTMIQT